MVPISSLKITSNIYKIYNYKTTNLQYLLIYEENQEITKKTQYK